MHDRAHLKMRLHHCGVSIPPATHLTIKARFGPFDSGCALMSTFPHPWFDQDAAIEAFASMRAVTPKLMNPGHSNRWMKPRLRSFRRSSTLEVNCSITFKTRAWQFYCVWGWSGTYYFGSWEDGVPMEKSWNFKVWRVRAISRNGLATQRKWNFRNEVSSKQVEEDVDRQSTGAKNKGSAESWDLQLGLLSDWGLTIPDKFYIFFFYYTIRKKGMKCTPKNGG